MPEPIYLSIVIPAFNSAEIEGMLEELNRNFIVRKQIGLNPM